MIQCDLCKKEIKEGIKHIENPKNNKKICVSCIEICSQILKDPTQSEKMVVYLNQYKEEIERRKIKR